MKRVWLIWMLFFLTPFAGWAAEGAVEEVGESPKESGPVYVIPIRDDIMPPVLYVVRRGIKEALAADASLVVLDMETNGGRVDTTEELIEILDRFEGRKVTYVNKKAFSAGAFISVATESIYMAPGSVIGAAAPILMAPGGTGVEAMPNTMEVKMTSGISALVRANAERYGHNVDVIEAMIDKSKELNVDGQVLCEKGQILTLTNTEAGKEYGDPGKPLLSSGTVPDLSGLIRTLGLEDAELVRIDPTGTEQLGAWVNRISPILLMIGIIGLYLEFKTPGFGLPGIIGLGAFVLYFLGGYIAGLSSIGWGAVFVVGLLLLIVELLLIPGTLITGLVGAAMMLGAIIMALVDWDPTLPAYAVPNVSQFALPLRSLTQALFGALLFVLIIGRYLPETRLYRRMVSATASGMETEDALASTHHRRVGQTGEVLTALRPGGKVRFGDETLDVISQGEMIEVGATVKIIDFSGSDPVVVSI